MKERDNLENAMKIVAQYLNFMPLVDDSAVLNVTRRKNSESIKNTKFVRIVEYRL